MSAKQDATNLQVRAASVSVSGVILCIRSDGAEVLVLVLVACREVIPGVRVRQ